MVVWLIDVIKHFFGGHLDLPETKKLKNSFVLMHEPSKNVKTFHGFFCLRPTAEGPSNYASCSGHFVNLLLGCTSGLNLAADLGPVLALFKVIQGIKVSGLDQLMRSAIWILYALGTKMTFLGLIESHTLNLRCFKISESPIE